MKESNRAPYYPLYIANYVITYCERTNVPLTNLKLRNVLYYLKARFLVEQNGTVLFDEPIQKWQYGMAVPSVCAEYKRCGADPIKTSDVKTILRRPFPGEKPTFFGKYVAEKFETNFIEQDDQAIINDTVDRLTNYDGFNLMHQTTEHKYPIKRQWGIITDEQLKQYFEENTDAQLWVIHK